MSQCIILGAYPRWQWARGGVQPGQVACQLHTGRKIFTLKFPPTPFWSHQLTQHAWPWTVRKPAICYKSYLHVGWFDSKFLPKKKDRKTKPPVDYFNITETLLIHLSGIVLIQWSRNKVHTLVEDRIRHLYSLGCIGKVKCTQNRFRASLECGAIWLVSSMINDKSLLILGLIYCATRLVNVEFLVLCTSVVDSQQFKIFLHIWHSCFSNYMNA